MYNKLLLLIAPVTHGLLLEFFWTDGCSGAPFNPTSSECSLLGGGTYGKHRMLLQEIRIALRVLAACGGAEEIRKIKEMSSSFHHVRVPKDVFLYFKFKQE